MNQYRFIVGPPVRGDNFFGREKELNQLVRSVANGINTLVLGERRFGKSSLILHYSSIVSSKHSETFPAIFIDSNITNSVEELSEMIKRRVEKFLGVTQSRSGSGLNQVYDTLVGLAQNVERVVLFIDDMDHLLYRDKEEGNHKAASFLRALSQTGHYVTCATSYRDIALISSDCRSPLYNLFVVLPLGPWPKDEALNFLQKVSKSYGDELNEEECNFIIDLAGRIPFHLQLFGNFLFQEGSFIGSSGETRLEYLTAAADEFADQMARHWGVTLSYLADNEKNTLIGIIAGEEQSESTSWRQLALRGLIDKKKNNVNGMGSFFKEYMSTAIEHQGHDQKKWPRGITSFAIDLTKAAVKATTEAAIKAYLK